MLMTTTSPRPARRRPRPPLPDHRGSRSTKILDRHLDRLAIVYVRQSTPQQVLEHKESRERQYALADTAVALGWPKDRVLIIDEDQGHSGKDGAQRTRVPAPAGRGHHGPCRDRAGAGDEPLVPLVEGLASSAGGLCPLRDAPGRPGWRLRPPRFQRQAPAWV